MDLTATHSAFVIASYGVTLVGLAILAAAILRRDGREERLPSDPVTTYFHQLRAVLNAIRDRAPLPTEGADALRQQQTLDRIYDAAGLAHLRYRQRT